MKFVMVRFITYLSLLLCISIHLYAEEPHMPHMEWYKIFNAGVPTPSTTTCRVDNNGNVYLGGSTTDSILTMGDYTLHFPEGAMNLFIAKLDSNGTLRWVSKYGPSLFLNYPLINGITINSEGNCLVSDNHGKSFTQYDTAGNMMWTKTLPGTRVGGFDADNYGNYYTRYYDNNNDIYHTIKINNTGNTVWSRTGLFPGKFDKEGNRFKIDMALEGQTVTVDTFTIFSTDGTGYRNFILSKYDPDGNLLWAKKYHGTANEANTVWSYGGQYDVFFNNAGEIEVLMFTKSTSASVGAYEYYNNTGKTWYWLLLKFDANGDPAQTNPGVVFPAISNYNINYVGLDVNNQTMTAFDSFRYLNFSNGSGIVDWTLPVIMDYTLRFKRVPELWGEFIQDVVVDGKGNFYIYGFIADSAVFWNKSIKDPAYIPYHNELKSIVVKYSTTLNHVSPVTKFRTFTQSDFAIKQITIPKKGKRKMPNAGNARDITISTFLATRNQDFFIGIPLPNTASSYGWIRLLSQSINVKSFFVQKGKARGFDVFGKTPFVNEHKNIVPKKYSNKLAGELAALKLNILASCSFVTPNGFGNLVFNDSTQPTHIFNGLSMWQIPSFVDTTLTYYNRFYQGTTVPPMYALMATTLESLNNAFRGAIDTVSTAPLTFTGVKPISDVYYVHLPNGKKLAGQQAEPFTQQAPAEYTLLSVYPSPFNPTTRIRYTISQPGFITVKVYNTIGQEVETLVQKEYHESGVEELEFNAANLSSGIYFVHLETTTTTGATQMKTSKIVLMK